ncbi:hypothetical protein DdX_20437 [Ditylenchus destructor]|uniref:Uncharacterized protein n=1 Tax=Ditylenchus destructor TaxID=166010 RepID=A0AAD4MH70_9BILA|nr:hypothetical protein DdX_20437 [Ditylenchus destructor]
MTNQGNCQQSYMSGIVLTTNSDDYPYVVFCGNNLPLYMFPDSLLFGEELRQETKSMTNKMKERLITGDPITFKADCSGIVTTYIRDSRSSGGEVSNKGFTMVTTEAVFSPEVPPQCFALKFGVVPYSADPSKLVVNLVYKVKLAITPDLGTANRDDELPRPTVSYEVVEAVQPIFRLDTLYEAPWITEDNRILSFNVDGEGISYRKIEWDIKLRIKEIHGVVLENDNILWSKQPGFKVYVACKRDNKEKNILRPGRKIRATKLVYHSFLTCYIAREYSCYLEDKKMPVPTKFIIPGSEPILVYQVDLKHSQWTDFYTAEQFGEYCLVDDPHLFLINAQEDRETFPAWVYQKDDDACVAKFSIAEINDESYSEKELANIFPNIHGLGLLVNNRTGSVFSKDHPMKRIKLMLSDRSSMEVGDYFHFEAKFHPYSFVIIKIEIIKHQRFRGKIIPWRDSFLFETELVCGEFRASRKAYPSLDLGLVTDTEGIIATRASRKNKHEVVTAYVEENTDVNRSSFFNVYKMFLSEKEIALERPTTMIQPRNWWQGNAPAKCRCRKSKELFAEIIGDPAMRDLVKLLKNIPNLDQFILVVPAESQIHCPMGLCSLQDHAFFYLGFSVIVVVNFIHCTKKKTSNAVPNDPKPEAEVNNEQPAEENATIYFNICQPVKSSNLQKEENNIKIEQTVVATVLPNEKQPGEAKESPAVIATVAGNQPNGNELSIPAEPAPVKYSTKTKKSVIKVDVIPTVFQKEGNIVKMEQTVVATVVPNKKQQGEEKAAIAENQSNVKELVIPGEPIPVQCSTKAKKSAVKALIEEQSPNRETKESIKTTAKEANKSPNVVKNQEDGKNSPNIKTTIPSTKSKKKAGQVAEEKMKGVSTVADTTMIVQSQYVPGEQDAGQPAPVKSTYVKPKRKK